ncbi:MAG: 5'-methylthioadenosine/adenosylhomocysteine nucleosidase [Odoribacter splanchnicus]|nr:5'-methylthioadenosine/adenosylhomocysteine nucleosidase [Odoribacter splanchnicus]
MGKIGIIVAMTSEFNLVNVLLEEKHERHVNGFSFVEGRLDGKEVVLAKSGIGKVCAAVGVSEMIREYSPACIVNTGVAGGIDASLQVMDIVVGGRTVYHDVWCGEGNAYGQIQGLPAFFEADARLLKAALSIGSDVRLLNGLICTGDQFITDRVALNKIKDHFPEGFAVDMESCAMAQVCYLYRVPFLSFRIISDTPGRTDDHSLQYREFWTIAPEKSFEVLRQLIARV